jgi:hypothetical protein
MSRRSWKAQTRDSTRTRLAPISATALRQNHRALIGVGGFLGIGEKNVAVRFEHLKFTRDENSNIKVALDISEEALASAPAYKMLEEEPVVEGSAKSDSGDKTKTYTSA